MQEYTSVPVYARPSDPTTANGKIHLILLAAGFSRRFGENKLLYELDGRPMYEYPMEVLRVLNECRRDIVSVCVVSQYGLILEAAAKTVFVLWRIERVLWAFPSSFEAGDQREQESGRL